VEAVDQAIAQIHNCTVIGSTFKSSKPIHFLTGNLGMIAEVSSSRIISWVVNQFSQLGGSNFLQLLVFDAVVHKLGSRFAVSTAFLMAQITEK